MTAQIIDGKKIAMKVRDAVKDRVNDYLAEGKRAPNLSVILVGDNPASQIYVSHKERACKSVGITSTTNLLPADTSQEKLLACIDGLNQDPNIDGILLQLPLPRQLDRVSAIASINPDKDVDGLTPQNQGRMLWQTGGLFPCTPLGVMELIRSTEVPLSGKVASIVGRSLLVGMPIGLMLELSGCTIIGLHSESTDLAKWTRQSDIVVVATGVHHLVKGDWIKPGAIVIDVGMHRIGAKLAGDVCFEEAKEVAGYISPVPGGVGPMTIAMLISNCLKAYEFRLGLKSHTNLSELLNK